MKYKLILIHCPHGGIFRSLATTFVAYNKIQIDINMASKETFEFDQARDWLTTSSAFNQIEFDEALSKGNGFQDLIDLAKKWGWNVSIAEGNIQ